MENFNTKNILNIILPHWRKLVVVAIVSVIVGFIISSPLVIKPLYKSYAVVYPVNLSPSSEESNTEQLLQWFNSEEVKKAVENRFQLKSHYKIDSTDEKSDTYFNLKYKELISINATLYESIEISVKDQSKELAREIVLGIIEETNRLILSVKKERLKEYILNNENELKIAGAKIDSLKSMINGIHKMYNIMDYKYQSKYIAQEISKGSRLSEQNARTVEGLSQHSTELDRLKQVIKGHIITYNELSANISKYHLDFANEISFTNVVSKPTLPDTKCYPIRSLIVVIITLSSLLIACIIIVFLNIKQKVD